LAWNRAAAAVFGDYARLEGGARNIMHLMSGNLAHGVMLARWPSLAAAALGMFRADSAPYRGDPDFERLISKLAAASGEFREGWPPPGDRRSSFGQQAHRSSGCRTYSVRTYEFRRFRRRGAPPCGLSPVAEGVMERRLAVRDARHIRHPGREPAPGSRCQDA
jgi:hypothetical protein